MRSAWVSRTPSTSRAHAPLAELPEDFSWGGPLRKDRSHGNTEFVIVHNSVGYFFIHERRELMEPSTPSS
eukprot:2372222-Pyramimonas_sp.AAC.1